MHKTDIRLGVALGALISASFLLGGAAHSETEADEARYDTIVVTSTRVETELNRLGYSVNIFDEQDIEKAQSVQLTDILVQSPGVTMTRVGGPGQNSSVRIRGGDSDHVLLVVDGVKMSDPSTTGGGSDFSEIMIGDIAQIEVLRGPQSTLWGSQAMSGVVSVVTAVPTEPFEGKLLVEAGSRDTLNTRLGIGGKQDKLIWRLAGSYYETDGISSLDKRLGGVEPDGFRNTTFSGRLEYNFTDDIALDLRGFYSDGRTELDNVSGRRDSRAYTLSTQYIGYAGLRFNLLSDRLRNRLSYQYTDVDGSRNDPDVTPSVTRDTIGRTERFEYQGTYAFSEAAELAFGAETQEVHVSYKSPTAANPNPVPRVNDIGLDSVYTQLKIDVIPSLTLTGGIRYDDHQFFGGRSNGQVSAAWRFSEAGVLRASWGQGFNAPTAYQLFDARYGNEDVRPEDSRGSWDVSIEHGFFSDNLKLSAGVFQTRTHDLIVVTNCTADPTSIHCLGTGRPGFYSNVDRAKAEGVELQASLRLSQTRIATNYTYTEAQDVRAGRDLARTPRHTVNVSVDHDWTDRIHTGLTAGYVGDSYNNAANTQELDGFVLIGLRASYDLTETLSLFGRVDNMFDEHYVTNLNYGTEGRSFNAGFRLSF